MQEQAESDRQRAWAKRWLSPSRLEPYLSACHNDIELALELHEWNLRFGHAIMTDIAHFELALRNSYNQILVEKFNNTEHWLFADDSPVRKPIMRMSKTKRSRDTNLVNRRAIDDAISRAHDPSNPDQVIAGLMLGFWVHMTDRSRERDLWIPYLNAAWPAGANRANLHLKLSAINKLRNRIAHNERLFNPGKSELSPRLVDADAINLLKAICPEAHAHLYKEETGAAVNLFLQNNPAPVEVAV